MSGEHNNGAQSGGIGFVGALTVLFVGLKLTGYIDWSWWWVAAPVWIATAVALLVFVVVLAGLFISDQLESRRRRRRT